jgi:hypothetical protein
MLGCESANKSQIGVVIFREIQKGRERKDAPSFRRRPRDVQAGQRRAMAWSDDMFGDINL